MDKFKQYKLFRKRDVKTKNNNLFIFEYGQDVSYSKFIKEKKDKGYRQLIVHSKLLMKLVDSFLDEEDILIRNIILNRELNEELNEEIKDLLKDYKSNPEIKYELYRELFWTFDKDSIDIEKIELAFKVNDSHFPIKIVSSGVISGKNIVEFFNNYLKGPLYGDLNES